MSQKKKKKEPTTATITINNPKAAVLDYRQLKITLQTASKSISHRLPPCTDISKHFSRFGDCKVESIGKSNQYLIKYTTPNSGCIACRTISKENNTLINKVWNISSIKYQWNSYCSSIFHPNKSNLSICAKGPQKCGKIHQLVHNDQAFVPIGNKTKDNLSFEKFKQLRWQLYREHDTVHDIEDWHNIEGITTVNINDNEYESESDSSSSSSMLLGTMTKREPMVAGAVTSSHIERMREKKRKELLSGILKKQVKNGNAEWKCLSQRNRARANAEKLLKQKNKKKKRASPPLRPVQCNNKIEEVSDVVSVGSYRSARSTVYVKPDRDVTVTDSSSSDSESSSSRSASGLFNTKGALGFKNDWNKLNDENNKSNKVKSERKVKKNDKDKSDAISMRYLNKNKKKIVSKSNKVDKKIKSVRKVKAVHVPCTPSPSPPTVPESVKEKENGSESSNAKTVSSMTSAEKTAYRAVRSVLGENKVNLGRSRVGNRVPIIDPNKRSVSYLQSKRSMITHQNNYGNSNVNMNMNQNNIRGGFHTLPNNNQNNSNRMRRNLNNMGGMGNMNNMNQMSNVMMQPMNNMNSMNNMNNMNQMGNMNALINAPPFFPTFQNQPQPRAPMSNFMNSMNVSGSILAGTFKTNTQLQQPQTQPQPQQTIYNQSPPNMYNQSPVYNNKYNQSNQNQKIQNQNNINNQNQNNQNQNNMNNQYNQNKNQNNLNQNKNKNNMKSSPTSTLKRAQLRKQHLRKQPKIIDYSDAKYDYKHVTILPSPSSVEDYHWLCFHFRSGEKYSCTYGSECRWRHYDFEMRADIQTAWNPSNPIIKYKPRMPQLAEARILRKSIEKKYKWLADKKYSKNPYIHENNTPPSMKKIRVENHKRNKQIIENKDGNKVKMSSRKKLIIENDQDEKEKININKDKKKDIDKEVVGHVHVINNAEENKDKDEDNDKDKNEGNIINDKIKCVLRDYDTAMSMMTPFCNDSRNNPNVNYHLIGQLAYQQFAALRKIICELKK